MCVYVAVAAVGDRISNTVLNELDAITVSQSTRMGKVLSLALSLYLSVLKAGIYFLQRPFVYIVFPLFVHII